MRSFVLVSVAVVAVGCGGASTSVTPSSVPPGGGAPATPDEPGGGNVDAGAGGPGGAGAGGSGGDGGVLGGGGGSDGGGTSACTATSPQLIMASNALYGGATGFAVDNRFVYAVTAVGKFRDFVLYREDKAPGGTQAVYWGPADSSGVIATLAMDGDFLFVLPYVGGGFSRWNKDGSGMTSFASSNAPLRELVAEGGTIYVASSASGTLYAIDEASGATTTLAQQLDQPMTIASDGTYLYFNSGNRILRLVKSGGAPEIVVDAASASGTPSAVTVDAASLFWGDTSGTIWVAGKAPGASGRSIAQSGFYVDRILADGGKLYVASGIEPRTPTTTPFDSLVALAKDGSGIAVLDAHAGTVYRMATDAQYLYYTGAGLMRICK